MVRWDYLPAEKANYAEIGEQIFLTDLARELAAELGIEAPQELARKEELKFDTLDPEIQKNICNNRSSSLAFRLQASEFDRLAVILMDCD
jgi:hypothetical protein